MLWSALSLALAVFTSSINAVAVSVSHPKRYTIRCNDNSLTDEDMHNTVAQTFALQLSQGVAPGEEHHLVKSCKAGAPQCAYVSLRAEFDKYQEAPASDIAQGIQFIIQHCGSAGGSGPALYHENLVVHLHRAWV